MAVNYIEITHTNPKLTDLSSFIEYNMISDFTDVELLNYEDNQTSMFLNYSYEDKVQFQQPVVNLLRVGTTLKVPQDKIEREIISSSGNIVVPNEHFSCFIDDRISQIIRNPSYKPMNLGSSELSDKSRFFKISNQCTVWVWSRVLGKDNPNGLIFNLTPFIQNVQINVAESGGNFTVSLPDLPCIYDDNEGWTLDKSVINSYVLDGDLKANYTVKSDFAFKSFFSTILSVNDLIFIQFEALEMEDERMSKSYNSILDELIISPAKLPKKNWDFIGLLDSVKTSESSPTAERNVNISGRCLMKTLIDDGCYFYPLDFLNSENQYYDNYAQVRGEGYSSPIKRLVSGELSFFNAYVDRSIEFSLKFVLNLLSNVEYVPSSLFRYFTNRTKRYEFFVPENDVVKDDRLLFSSSTQRKLNLRDEYNSEREKNKARKINSPGIWSIIKLVIDENLANRRLVDSSITMQQGSLINFVNKIVQKPFAEFYGDTYGNQYYFMVKKPPYDEKSWKTNYVTDIENHSLLQVDLMFDEGQVASWYRIVPRGNFFGDDSGISLAYFPAVFFEDYAKVFGVRSMEVVSNYIDYGGISGSSKSIDLDYLTKQAINDLSYIITSNAYLPFTRKGQIVINGDRRIKRGTLIRLKKTGEVFYVDSVSNSYSVNRGSSDRTTILNVSRGMVEKYTKDKKFNYFKIIDQDRSPNGTTRSVDFKVNKEVFDFFLKRKQYV